MPHFNPEKQLSRRMFLLAGLQVGAGFALLGRLYYLQFVKSEEYRTLAEGNRIKIQLIAPARGDILDRSGEPLAENKVNYRLFIEREQRKQAQQSFRRLTGLITIAPKQQSEIEQALQSRLNRKPLMVKEYLSWAEVTRVEYHIPDLPGTYIEQGQVRHYPLGEAASHLIGYVGRVTEREMEKEGLDKQSPLYRLPESKIGKNGIELLYEKRLRGKAGARHVEVNASGLPVRELKLQPGEKGETLNLTIDRELQAYAAERMGNESGAIVVMDAISGALIALVSMPAFDPNRFSKGISTDYWQSLKTNEKNPLLNKALSGLYPPGSTYKMLVGLAGLKEGVTDPHRSIYCPGHFYLGRHRFNCWKPGGHGAVNMKDAIAESCDTYFYTIGHEMGITPIIDMSRRFGLGKTSGLGLIGEKAGLLPTPEWKKRTYNVPWVKGDTVNASIGQGFVLTSPIQLAIMGARLVNGGRAVSPHLFHEETKPAPRIEVEPSHLALMLRGMNAVINADNGTAYHQRIKQENYNFGGKTGTSQVRRLTVRGQDQSDLPWRLRHHGLFVGYAPVEEPRFVASVVIEHGGGGASAAAPVARDVLLKLQQLADANPQRYRR